MMHSRIPAAVCSVLQGAALILVPAVILPPPARADHSFAEVVEKVNPKLVKVFGAGGYRGVTAYCSGILVSPEGHVLTVYSPTIDSSDIRVHLWNGEKLQAELVATEPQLDIALLKVRNADKLVGIEYFDVTKIPVPPEPGTPKVGDWVLAFSNQFEIATRNEPMSVQRGVISAIVPFAGRKGVAEATYKGRAIIVDAITNNPGSHGGALTNRKGELIGIIGKEMKNVHTETWVNYAMPISKEVKDFIEKAKAGTYKKLDPTVVKIEDKKATHGIILVPNVLDRTPPYIEEVLPDSPAAKAGLRPDDLIVFIEVPSKEVRGEFEERIIGHWQVFRDTLAPLDPGTTVKIVVRRGQQLLKFELELGPSVQPKNN
jgi:S1-C subfamily serine protease